jgi:UDP-N-acetyl-D-mannosaminuronic acid dehydrogenase
MTFKKVSVVGLGYIGLPTAALIASNEVEVVGFDVDFSVVDTVNKGEIHIVEPGLEKAVKRAVERGFLRAICACEPADAFLIAVPTPFKEGFTPDLKFIKAAVRSIAPVLEAGNLVVLESTSPVGATEKMSAWLEELRPDLSFPQTMGDMSDIRIAYCPERVLPGQAMRELVENDRVIGGMTSQCSVRAQALYKVFVDGNCITTNTRTAEMCKLTENSFRDVNLAFANEISMICDQLDIDAHELISLANLHPRVDILRPGPGVGGHCIAVDPWFLVHSAPETAKLLKVARGVNDFKPEWVCNKIKSVLAEKELEHVICLGLTYKPDVDDMRESPSLKIYEMLAENTGVKVSAVDPFISGNNAQGLALLPTSAIPENGCLIVGLVAHAQFKTMSFGENVVLDFSGIWEI